MRSLIVASLAMLVATGSAFADDKDTPKQAPNIVLKSPDGKKTYDLAKLTAEGPVLVRLTCACVGCDAEVGYFQKLQEAYNKKGLQTIAVFREKAESVESYVTKKDIKFMWTWHAPTCCWKPKSSSSQNRPPPRGQGPVAAIG
jgi:thiol-disulfide isomerase/thioredoxin